MISVSQEVIDLINADSRTFRAKFKHGDSVYDKIMSLKWNVCLPSSSFSIGNALSIGIQCTAFDVPVSIKGEELELVITIEGSADEISIGSFTAEKPTIQNGIVSFNAYDDMSRAGNIPYNSTLGEGKHTVNQYVADVAETLGIDYISLGSEGEVTVENDYLSGNSCRNALAYLAGYLGRNCVIKNKKISMKKFTLVDYTMNADRIEEPELEDIDSEIDFIIAQISSNNTIMNGNGATGTELVCPIMTESQLSNVANMLFGDASPVKTYRSGNVKLLLGDPRLELCDVIKLDYKDAEYIIPITSVSFEYDGGLMTDLEAYALKEPTLLTPSQRLDFAVQEEVKKVLAQLKNIDGIYFYIRYSPNADGSNMTEEPDDKTEYIGVCSTNQSSAPGEASAYTWSKFKGKDGSSNFFHVKYSNDGGKTFTGTDGETAGEYIGILVDSNEDDSTNPSDYTWSKIVGKDGKGISEVINYYLTTDKADGVTRDDFGGNTEIVTPDKDKPYLWNYEEIRYTSGNPTYTDPCIIGNFAENGSNGRGIKSITEYYLTTQTESTPSKTSFKGVIQTPSLTYPFLWNYEKIEYTDNSTPYESDVRLIGVYGSDGKSLFTWVKYADDASGTNMSDDATGKKYMGIAYNKTLATESTTASDYAWSKIQGDNGRGVSKVVTEYYLSTSETTQTGGSWSEDALEWVDGRYLWTRLVTYYTDGTNTPSDPVVDASWKKTSVVDEASKELNETLANALGLYVTEYPVNGGKIRYYHSNPILESSTSDNIILVFNSNGFGVCTTGWNGGNPEFENGMDFGQGKAIWNVLIANKISADLIEAGVLSSRSNSDLQTKLDLATGILKFIFSEGQVVAKGFTVGNEADLTAEQNEELKWVSLNRWPGVHMNMTMPERSVCAYYTPAGLMVGDSSYIESIAAYAIQQFKYECGKGTEPIPLPDFLVSEVGPEYISTKEVLCSNLVYISTAGREKNLKDLDSLVSSLSSECENLKTSLASLQQKYAELLEEIGKACEHPSTVTKQENVVNPTCTTQGSYDNVVYCATCGEEITDSRETITTDALGHNYTSSITKQPTCTEQGTRKYTCSVCGSSYTENISATGHTDSNGDGYCDACGTAVGTFYTVTLEVSPTGGGTVSQSGNGTYVEDTVVTLSATPNNGYYFLYWTDGNENRLTETIQVFATKNQTWTAVFEAEELTISEGETKTVNVAQCTVGGYGESVPITDFTLVKFVPTVTGTYQFEVTDSTSSDTCGRLYNSTKTTVLAEDDDAGTGNHFLFTYDCEADTAYYIAVKFYGSGIASGTADLLVTHLSSGGGSTETKQVNIYGSSYGSVQVSRNGSIVTGVDNQYTFNIGDTVTLTATPNSGYSFTVWRSMDDFTDLSTENPYTFVVSSSTPSAIQVYF